MSARLPFAIAIPLLATLLAPTGATAQDCPTCIPPYRVAVTPDNSTTPSRPNQTSGWSATFTVKNTGSEPDVYEILCTGKTGVTCTGTDSATVTLAPSAQVNVVAFYSVGAPGTGRLALRALPTFGDSPDSGTYNVPIVVPAGAPVVDATPYKFDKQDYARCALACFAATYAQGTVPYFSIDAPRSVMLAYNGDRLNPKPFVHVDVTPDLSVGTPTEYRLQVRVNGAFVTFVNGESTLRFAYATSAKVRLGGQFDASTYATGAYSMEIIVASLVGSNLYFRTVSTKLVVVNETNAPLAKGWTVAGVQRLYAQGDGSMVVTEGDGSAVYFTYSGGTFTAPVGEFSQLVTGIPDGGSGWTRRWPDSTKAVFNTAGLMTEVRDRFNSVTSVVYDGSNRVYQMKDPLNNTITLTYDGNGLTSIQDPGGRVTDIVVDASRRLTTITAPDNVSTTFGYDGSLRLRAVTNRAGQTDSLTYLVINSKETNKLASVKGPAVPVFDGGSSSPVTTFEPWQIKGVPYDTTSGTPLSAPLTDTVYARITEPLGSAYVTRFTVNPWGSPVQTTNPLGEVTTIAYHGTGLPWTVQRPGFGTARDTLLYNGSGLLTYQRPAGDSATTITYGAWAQPTSVARPGQPTVSYTLGALGVVSSVSWGGATRASYLYDGYGRVTRVTDALSTVVRRLGYPTTGTVRNLTHDTLPGTRVTVYAYDTYGRATTVTPPSGPQQVTHYNILNWVDSVRTLTNPVTRVKFAYNPLGQDTSVTDPQNQMYRYTYNALGWLIKQVDPVGARDTFQYNVGGELRRSTNRLGQHIDFAYDTLHRLKSRAGSLTSTWTYSANSLVVTAAQPGIATVTTYPSLLGPPDSVKTVLNGSTYWQRYRYGMAGLDSVYFTGSQDASHLTVRRYRYTATTGALDSIRLATSATALARNANLATTTVDFPGSTITNTTIGSLQSTLTATTEATNNNSLERWLGFNALGQIDRHLRYGARVGFWFAYDSLGQLRATRLRNQSPEGSLPPSCPNFDYGMSGNCTPNVDYVTMDSVAYAYDAVGNRTDQGGTYTTANRITAFAGCTYQTDAAGHVVSRKGTSPCVQIDTLLWTAEGWLDSLKMGATGIKFLYDAAGRLTVKRVNGAIIAWFLWDGANLLAELNGAGDAVLTEYSSYGMDAPHAVIKQPAGTRLYARMDGLGNVIALTDTSGAIRTSYSYDDWGKSAGSSDQEGFSDRDRARWKGALWMGPELDVYYMRARWYEPSTGRFLSEDPIGLAGGINPYVYVWNDPINGRDPSGMGGAAVLGVGLRVGARVIIVTAVTAALTMAVRDIQQGRTAKVWEQITSILTACLFLCHEESPPHDGDRKPPHYEPPPEQPVPQPLERRPLPWERPPGNSGRGLPPRGRGFDRFLGTPWGGPRGGGGGGGGGAWSIVACFPTGASASVQVSYGGGGPPQPAGVEFLCSDGRTFWM